MIMVRSHKNSIGNYFLGLRISRLLEPQVQVTVQDNFRGSTCAKWILLLLSWVGCACLSVPLRPEPRTVNFICLLAACGFTWLVLHPRWMVTKNSRLARSPLSKAGTITACPQSNASSNNRPPSLNLKLPAQRSLNPKPLPVPDGPSKT